MKIPLRYQTTEFDCGPTALMNAVSFLFDIETIPPEIPKHISTIGNDRCDPSGRAGWWGTSPDALCYAACWLNTFSRSTGSSNGAVIIYDILLAIISKHFIACNQP